MEAIQKAPSVEQMRVVVTDGVRNPNLLAVKLLYLEDATKEPPGPTTWAVFLDRCLKLINTSSALDIQAPVIIAKAARAGPNEKCAKCGKVGHRASNCLSKRCARCGDELTKDVYHKCSKDDGSVRMSKRKFGDGHAGRSSKAQRMEDSSATSPGGADGASKSSGTDVISAFDALVSSASPQDWKKLRNKARTAFKRKKVSSDSS